MQETYSSFGNFLNSKLDFPITKELCARGKRRRIARGSDRSSSPNVDKAVDIFSESTQQIRTRSGVGGPIVIYRRVSGTCCIDRMEGSRKTSGSGRALKKRRKKRAAQAGLCDYANAPTTRMLSTRDTCLTCAFKSPLVFLKRYEFLVSYSVAEDFLNKTTKISRHSIPSERSLTIDRRA